MKKRKQLLIVGLIVAVMTVAGVSAYAAETADGGSPGIVQEFGQKLFGGGRGQGGPGQGDHGSNGLEQAVEEGILTEADVEAIEAYREANRPDMDAIQDELEGLSKDEIKAYMEENYPRPEDPHAELVEAGIITQEQVDALDALRAEFEANRPEGEGRGQGGPGQGGHGEKGLESAVEAGILTEAEVEAIQAYQEANRPDMDAILEELEGLSKDEIKAYMEENYPRPEDPHADLVEAGLISQEQADALDALRAEFEANRPEGEGFGEGRGQGGPGRNSKGNGEGTGVQGMMNR